MQILKSLKDKLQGKIPNGSKRSPKWPKVRNDFIKKNPKCAVCGGIDKCEIHHVVPFHINPELELVESNLITLCESKKNGLVCHLGFGHLGNYKSYNKDVIKDAAYWNKKLKERP